jgi:hypothetical protein
MRRIIALLGGALLATGTAVEPAPPVSAGSASVGSASWSVTVTLPDMQWIDTVPCQYGQPQYERAEVQVTGVSVDYWRVEGDVSNQADGQYVSDLWLSGSGTGTFVFPRAIEVCPERVRNGVHVVTGQVSVTSSPSEVYATESMPFATTFTVSAMPTTTTLTTPSVIGTQTTFSGKVLATSAAKGPIGADRTAQVAIEALAGTTWTRIGIGNLDTTGNYAIPVATVLPAGTQLRATYPGTTTCAASLSVTLIVPAAPRLTPSVKLRAVSGRSKLKVDVNPNMGRKYWTFQVQRKNTDGSWKALRTYRTWGSWETRTVNLRRGLYRVWVNPKFGYQGVMSTNEVMLRR